jgi:hypoxanthine phosphoribosyltransferase
MSKKLWYSWDEMRRDINVLCRDIVLDNFKPQVIVGISRGGLVPGVMMSHWFKLPFKPVRASMRDFPTWEDYLPKKTDQRVLIVDDICDSGKTFQKISSHITGPRKGDPLEIRCDIRFCSLWWNNEAPEGFEPHYYAQEMAKDSTKTWIHFPHELWWNAPV